MVLERKRVRNPYRLPKEVFEYVSRSPTTRVAPDYKGKHIKKRVRGFGGKEIRFGAQQQQANEIRDEFADISSNGNSHTSIRTRARLESTQSNWMKGQ